jgi:hypothetical protein
MADPSQLIEYSPPPPMRKFVLNSTADYYELVPCVLINYSWIGKKKLIAFPGEYHLLAIDRYISIVNGYAPALYSDTPN